jgi:uncharacterized protein (DUF433 family)
MDQKQGTPATAALHAQGDGADTTSAQASPGEVPTAASDRVTREGDTMIRETPGVCGGYPRVGHTRVSVRSIVVVYKETGGDFEQTAAAFDMLTREQIQAALDYYQAHPARVDEDIERNARAWTEITGQGWPG